ncbi:MAG: helix-turn-helix transcriptional regulator [Firmicutes bacterium]|nr:helix-turn-helix transcriptional regulator [Bacillota bacterium]
MLIGERIKQERIKRGLTQAELGNLLGVSKVSICGYETGARTPTVDTFLRLIDILSLTPEYALGRDMNVVAEKETEYHVVMAKEDMTIIEELKKHRELYNKLCTDPKRVIELISRKIK